MIQAPPFFTVACPSCRTEFPVDPQKVPPTGVHAICSECQRVFPVEVPEGSADPVLAGSITDGATAGDALGEAVEAATAVDVGVAEESVLPESVVEESVAEDLDEAEVDHAEDDDVEDEEVEDDRIAAAVDEPTAVDAPESAAAADEADDSDAPTATTEAPPASEPIEESPFEDLSSLTSEAMADEDLGDQLATSALSLAADRFGKRDPGERARRLARVLVSDIIAYFPARYRESFARGTVKADFEDEVKKSWKEYVDQVGLEVAESTPHFEDALNEILGKGEKIF